MTIAIGVWKTENGLNFHDNWKRVSSAGAIGVMQLEPVVAEREKVNPWDWRQNIKGGVKYLAYLFRRFGSPWLAVEAYNAGPTQVQTQGAPAQAVDYAKRVFYLGAA